MWALLPIFRWYILLSFFMVEVNVVGDNFVPRLLEASRDSRCYGMALQTRPLVGSDSAAIT
jgi:hypothetical protein